MGIETTSVNSLSDIANETAAYYGVFINDVIDHCQKVDVIKARHIGIALARELTHYSVKEVGKFFGLTHQPTLCAIKKIRKQRANSPEVDRDYNIIRDRLKTRCLSITA